jgi:hypothetical protein
LWAKVKNYLGFQRGEEGVGEYRVRSMEKRVRSRDKGRGTRDKEE